MQSSTSTIHVVFPEVIEGKINTTEFLSAAQDILRAIEKLGKVFIPVRSDMLGNITKLSNRHAMDTNGNATLQDMILKEKATETNLIATDALIWLTRGLHMILLLFEKITEDHRTGKATDDLIAPLKASYEEALEPYHGWMTQQLCTLLWRMAPTRSQFLKALADGQDAEEETILHNMEIYLENLRKNVFTIQAFYRDHDL